MPQHTVLLFAQLADSVGSREITIELEDQSTVEDALNTLAEIYPVLNSNKRNIAVAVNDSYAANNQIINAGEVIALIPPVSGG